jgi:hypothetical protein
VLGKTVCAASRIREKGKIDMTVEEAKAKIFHFSAADTTTPDRETNISTKIL